jgi:hypothetical protein
VFNTPRGGDKKNSGVRELCIATLERDRRKAARAKPPLHGTNRFGVSRRQDRFDGGVAERWLGKTGVRREVRPRSRVDPVAAR